MVTVDRVYKIREMYIVDKYGGGKMTILKIADANLGNRTFYDLQVDGEVLANKGDRVVIGKILGVNSNAISSKGYAYTNCQIKCEITGQNIIPN